MITLADAAPLFAVTVPEAQSPKTGTGDFGKLLSEVQGATTVTEGHTPEGLSALDRVLQSLADILQPLTFSLTPSAGASESTGNVAPSLLAFGSLDNGVPQGLAPFLLFPAAVGEATSPGSASPSTALPLSLTYDEADEDTGLRIFDAPPEESAEIVAGAVQATLAAVLAAQGSLQNTVRPPSPSVAPEALTSATRPVGGVTPARSASREQTPRADIHGSLPVASLDVSLADRHRTAEDSAPFSAARQAFSLTETATPEQSQTDWARRFSGAVDVSAAPSSPGRGASEPDQLFPDLATAAASAVPLTPGTLRPPEVAVEIPAATPALSSLHGATEGTQVGANSPLVSPVHPPVPSLSRVTLPDLRLSASEGLSDVQSPLVARTRFQDMREDAPEPTLSAISGTPDIRLASGASAVPGPSAPSQQDTLLSPPAPSDGLYLPQTWRLPGAANTVLLHINPPEFGPLLVHVRLHDKRLIASFQAESPDIEAILRVNLPALQAALSQQGFEVQPIALSLATDGFNTTFSNGTGSFSSQQQSTFHAFTQEQSGAEPEQRRNDSGSDRLFTEPRSAHRRLIDVWI